MIDLPQHAYMLQCYKCYNTTESASEGTVEGVPRNMGMFGMKFGIVFEEFFHVSIIGKLVEKRPVIFRPIFASSTSVLT